MSNTQMQAGMDWVESRFAELAEEQAVSIIAGGWKIEHVDSIAGRGHFVVLLNGQHRSRPSTTQTSKRCP